MAFPAWLGVAGGAVASPDVAGGTGVSAAGGVVAFPAGLAADRVGSARSRPSRRARTALRPLRTAPSIVSGQPVSVHEPASTRPGSSVAAFGRSRAVPGT